MLTHLVLPYPPSVNHLWTPIARYNARTRGHYGDLVLSAEARQYRQHASLDILVARAAHPCWPYQVPVAMTLHITPPDARKRDRDNILKLMWDCLVYANVIADDSLIQELHLYSTPPAKPGGIDVHIDVLNHKESPR